MDSPMNLNDAPEYQTFREEVRTFLEENKHMAEMRQGGGSGRPLKETRDWQKLLLKRGYTCRTFPKQYGGAGETQDIMKSFIISSEFTRTRMPGGLTNQGISMFAPTLMERGAESQRQLWIKPTLEGDVIWCQGYSEPGSGSDLASLNTSAIEDGDDFIINGQKIWTSGAHFSDMMFILVRTEPDAPKHEGISYLLLPMDTPGIEVRPLKTMTGRAEFNEVFFTDVRLPQDQIVGKRGQGWQVANTTLKHERGMLGDPGQASQMLSMVAEMMHEEMLSGQRLIEHPLYLDRLIQLQSRALAMKYNGLRLLTAAGEQRDAALAGMVVKLNGTELNHDIAAFAIDILGELGVLYNQSPYLRRFGFWQTTYMFSLGLIIGGGTSQIQKNIISERGLGMPKEPKATATG